MGLNAEREMGSKFYKGTSAGIPVSVYEASPGDVYNIAANEEVGSGIFICNFNGLTRLLEGYNWQNKILSSPLKRIKFHLDLFVEEKGDLTVLKKGISLADCNNFHLAARD